MKSNVVLSLSLLSMLSACATIETLGEAEPKNKIYSGTVRHAELKCAHATCIDLPFSLLADTVLLPITIPWAVVNLLRDDSSSEAAQGSSDAQGAKHNP